jgi:non-specific serine/threonine protein kinase/serine/threonine-protein kinase
VHSSAWSAKLGADLNLLPSEGRVSDPTAKSTPHNSDAGSDPEPTLDSAAAPVGVPALDLGSIGLYRLIRQLGEGGMGQVWLAEQSAPVKRQVALKIIRAARYDDSALLRFNVERQTLAIMDHPAIAKVFDAGSTAEGQPYFVMEYVPGLPITHYCDRKHLSVHERLALFIKVCEGVQHAHQKAIMHRDLKPSNILVVEVDGKPMPRIIDFGIAKAIPQQAEAETLLTRAGGMVGTLGYMSPEQADATVLDVDTRTDVYSLGVVLYELLTGVLPFDARQWRTKPFHVMLRRLHEEDPPSPSTRLSADSTSTTTAQCRNTDPRQLESLLRGDLDWIALKALEKDRARRYGTPSELGADVGRYLRNEPVVARPASTAYRTKKYVQRHKFGVAAATAMALLLIAFAVMQTIQLRRITRERDRADRVTAFMTGMFKVSNPSEARGNDIRAREILDKSSKEIDTGLANDPELQAQMMNVMGTVYQSLGLTSKAEPLLRRALEIRQRILGPRNPDTLQSQNDLAVAVMAESHYPEAEKLFRETMETRRQVLGPEHQDTVDSTLQLARILGFESRYAEAEKLNRDALHVARRKWPQDKLTATALSLLADTLTHEGNYPEAEKAAREALETDRKMLGSDHPSVLRDMFNLASILLVQQRYADAEAMYKELIESARRVLGPQHPGTLAAMGNLAALLEKEKRFADAEKLNRQVLDAQRQTLGLEHASTLLTMTNLGSDLIAEKNFSEAEKVLREALAGLRRVLGPSHEFTGNAAYNLSRVLVLEGKRDEALATLRADAETFTSVDELERLEKDDSFQSLHADPRFDAVVATTRQRLAAVQKQPATK